MLRSEFYRRLALAGLVLGASQTAALGQTSIQILQQVRTVFVIALENHNFTQPSPTSSPEQLKGNAAAPFLNSLITPGHSNAVHVAYATRYYNAGSGVHPSEPNYVWAEAGTTFGVLTDDDPSAASGNLFNAPHLTRQLNAAGISWRNYQEDLQFSASPTASASGYSPTATNSYNGSHYYDYAARHNPMVFFNDTQTQNVHPLSQLFSDLTNNAVGRYNWITPNTYNDMHNGLDGGFSYQGTAYSGDQAGIAQGDNFLAMVVPQIMASQAYRNNGLIVLWFDETEGGDNTSYTLAEILISPLAKGNAYASSAVLSHSSDLRTMEEVFGLSFISNAIPSDEVAATGGYYAVTNANDLSDLLQAVPAVGLEQPAGTSLTNGVSVVSFGAVDANFSLSQSFRVTNSGLAPLMLNGVTLAGANPGDFSVSGLSWPATIPAGSSATFSVAFSPTAPGPRSALLQISNNDSAHDLNPFTVTLSGAAAGSLSGRMSAAGFELSFRAAGETTYQVLGTADVTQPLSNWTVLTTGTVTNEPVIYTDPRALTNESYFYRLRLP